MRARFGWACLAALAMPVAVAPAMAASALPGGASSLQETFDNWIVSCVTHNDSKRCAISQQQVDQRSHERVVAVELTLAPGQKLRGTLVLPFGLALEKGVRLQIDDRPMTAALGIRTCVPAGCLVNLTFEPSFIAALRQGTNLKIDAVADGGKDANFTMPLKGFPGALDRMSALSK